jgi:hypothetical protein
MLNTDADYTLWGKPDEMTRRFNEFHRNNPAVLTDMVGLSMALRARGHKRYSIAGIFEVIRFRQAMASKITTNEPFKLNNNFKPHYARLIMEVEPKLRGFFETREARG